MVRTQTPFGAGSYQMTKNSGRLSLAGVSTAYSLFGVDCWFIHGRLLWMYLRGYLFRAALDRNMPLTT
jgi:hypothetical protein